MVEWKNVHRQDIQPLDHLLNVEDTPDMHTLAFEYQVSGVWEFIAGVNNIQFYLLLSPYLCFISFLHLDLYVLGDDALIS